MRLNPVAAVVAACLACGCANAMGNASTGGSSGTGGLATGAASSSASASSTSTSSGVTATTSGGTSSGSTTASSSTGSATSTGATTTGGATTTTGATTGAPIGLGVPCQLGSDGSDPCLTYGLYCTEQMTFMPGTCQLPPPGLPCLPTVGCADNSTVCAGPYTVINGMSWDVCVVKCLHTADCTDTTTFCDATVGACAPNPCGPGTNNGSTLWGPCGIDGVADAGTCFPYNGGGNSGLCTAFGTVAANQPCVFSRDGNSPADLCASDLTCIVLGSGSSFCAGVCSPPNSGVTLDCPTGADCDGEQGAVGWCVDVCVAGAMPDPCPTPLICTGDGCLPSAP
jgi:hypothetical protein